MKVVTMSSLPVLISTNTPKIVGNTSKTLLFETAAKANENSLNETLCNFVGYLKVSLIKKHGKIRLISQHQ